MSEHQFQAVAKIGEISDPGKQIVEVDDHLIAVIHTQGQYYAIDDICTHDGGPLAEGNLEGYEIVCPRHGARFDVRDGRALCLPATRPTMTHDLKVEGDTIYVRLRTA